MQFKQNMHLIHTPSAVPFSFEIFLWELIPVLSVDLPVKLFTGVKQVFN